MKKELLVFSFGLSTMLFSQTTITKSFNDPVLGDVVNNVIVNGTVDNSAVGNGVTFSNSGLTAGSAVVNTYSALTAAELTEFPSATIKHNDGNGTTIYYKQNPTTLEIVGIANSMATINLNTNPATAITYPTAYGNTFSDTTAGTTVYSGTNLNLNGTVNTTADAYGTLLIGTQTYPNVLRVKIVINLNISMLFIGNVGTSQNTMFMYYDNIRKYPLLAYTAGNVVAPAFSINESTSGAQAQNFIFLGTQDIAKKSMGIYPNPAHDVLNIKGIDSKTNFKIFSTEGRLLKSGTAENEQINVTELQPGVYFIQTDSNAEKPERLKFIKK
ncbi:MAG: T9SS type A sorting domain-containing protein [Bergeyella sp.]